MIIAVTGLIFTSGCTVATHQAPASVRSYFPILDIPELPQLEAMTPEELAAYEKLPTSLQVKLVHNNDKLQVCCKQMKAQLEAYNAAAAANNKTSDAALGIKIQPPVTGGTP